jgi:hypothetical protein
MPNDIERSEERIKQTGEVFTPAPLVNEMLDRIPEEVWVNPEKTFLDPSNAGVEDDLRGRTHAR